MAVLIYTEIESGKFKKSALEVASYGSALARSLGTEAIALTINANNPETLGKFGINKVMQVTTDTLSAFNASAVADVLAAAASKCQAKILVVSGSSDSRFVAPLLAGTLNASYIPNVVALPESISPLILKRTVFSNKGFAYTQAAQNVAIIGLSNNAFGIQESQTTTNIDPFNPDWSTVAFGPKVTGIDKASDKISIADADIVVSGGRGLKGPENWGMIEDLAQVLGAATACSKPVSDMGWRPHSEHVGQTGKPVASNLYIAVGISGAIQHLAGVNASKVKVVINNDPEAPFFKAADYGVIGDAFQVLPELTEKLKRFKEENA
ncbi:MAG: hypothetical protein RLZZ241_63 [Bacteroidota bacterium]|jgi:electron transfer flavoprotein alpha subunit